MNSYVQTSGKVPWSCAKRISPVSLRSANGGGPAAQLIISWRAFGWLACKRSLIWRLAWRLAFEVRPDADRPLDCKTRILRDLGGRLSAGNLFLTGHFFLPCCIQ